MRSKRPGNYVVEPLEPRVFLSAGYQYSKIADVTTTVDWGAGRLIGDSAGNLYGFHIGNITMSGKKGDVYEIAAGTHALTTLFYFSGSGYQIPLEITVDPSGNIFGLAASTNPPLADAATSNVVFEIAAGTHAFSIVTTSASIQALGGVLGMGFTLGGIASDSNGNVYVTTTYTTDPNMPDDSDSVSTIVKIAAESHNLSLVATFTAASTDGLFPANLLFDGNGDIFGTMALGNNHGGFGSIFEIPAGTSTVNDLFLFDSSDGTSPDLLTMDAQGDIFGATVSGGIPGPVTVSGDTTEASFTGGMGTLFELAAGTHAFTTLGDFDGTNGLLPVALDVDPQGNLFGITEEGGSKFVLGVAQPDIGNGTFFEVPAGSHTIIDQVDFASLPGSESESPSSLIPDGQGNFYGLSGFNVFELIAPPATQLVFAQSPATNLTAGQDLGTVSVFLENQFGSVVGDDDSAVTLLLNGGSGTLSGTTTVNAVNGIATFSGLAADTAGADTLSATDNGLASAISGPFTVAPGPASELALANQSATITAGVTTDIDVNIADQFGNPVPSAAGDITLAITSGPSMTLNGTLTVPATNGVADFSDLSLDTAGTYTYTATDNSNNTSTSGTITVVPNVAAKLGFAPLPAQIMAGLPVNPGVTVDVEDAYGNPTNTSGALVNLWLVSRPSKATLKGNKSIFAKNGSATFGSLYFTKAGNYQFMASGVGLSLAMSGDVSVVGGPRYKLVFVQQPTNSTAGGGIGAPVVELLDQYKNISSADTSSIVLSIASGPAGAAIGGSNIAAVSNGMATFSDTELYKAGRYRLMADDSGLTVLSKPFKIMPGAATNISFESQPAAVSGHSTIGALKVAVTDAFGNPVANGTSVLLAIDNGPDGAVLGGKLTAITHNGIATFGNIAAERDGDYTLLVTAGDASAISSEFTVGSVPPPA